MKTILAAIDFSPVTKRVVAEAAGLARDAGARVILPGNSDSTDFAREGEGGGKALTTERSGGLAATSRDPKIGAGAYEIQATADSLNRLTTPLASADRALRRGGEIFSTELPRQLVRSK